MSWCFLCICIIFLSSCAHHIIISFFLSFLELVFVPFVCNIFLIFVFVFSFFIVFFRLHSVFHWNKFFIDASFHRFVGHQVFHSAFDVFLSLAASSQAMFFFSFLSTLSRSISLCKLFVSMYMKG